MGIFDIFTGQPGIDAAEQNRNTLTNTQQNIFSRTDNAKNEAQNYINTGYGGARNTLANGYNAATGAINTGAGGALGYLDQGAAGAVGALQQGGGAYAPLSALAGRYGQGAGLYADALGINGGEGNSRAVGAFQRGPGYESGLNSGIDAIARLNNAQGGNLGGNVMRSAQTFGADYANKDYGSWLDRLSGYNNLELGATQGAAAGNAGINQNVAGILQTQGQNKAGVATGQGSSLADLARDYYAKAAGNDVGQYSALAGNVMGATNMQNAGDLNLAPQIGKTYNDAAAAQMAGSGNLWNFGLNAAKLAAGAAGGFGGFGGAKVADPTFGGFTLPGQSAASVKF